MERSTHGSRLSKKHFMRPEKVGKGEKWVGRAKKVAVEMVRVFQNDTMQMSLSLIQEDVGKQWEQNTDKDIVREFFKQGYFIGGFLAQLRDY